MKFKPNISNFKRSITAFLISVLCLSFLITPLTAHAGGADDIALKAATAFVNSISDDKKGGMNAIQNGVKFNRTGYLCYLLTKDGAIVPGCDARALQSPGYCGIDGAIWMCFSRAGQSVTGWYETATAANYWDQTPWAEGGSSNEPNIKSWLTAKTLDPNVPNAKVFVADVWGKEAALKFGSDEYILVIETIMSLQFSSPASGDAAGTPATLDSAKQAEIANICLKEANTLVGSMTDSEVYDELEAEGIDGYWGLGPEARAALLKAYAYDAKLKAEFMIYELLKEKGIEIANRVYHGSPVIGTVPNLIAYDVWDTTVFDSYLNNVAPHAEKIAKSEAGFTAYPGSGTISNKEVSDYGVAMMIVHCADLAQTTCDETQGDTPHNPPKESEGEVTIIKSYREKNPTTGTYIDKGTHHLNKLSPNITIEDEPTYKVVGWKTSTSGNTGISSLTWESDVPSIIGQTGTTATSVTLPATQKYLYVLLEKNSVVAPVTANYIIPQSTISRHISLNNPDAQLSLAKLSSHTFQWKMPDVDITACLLHKCGTTDSDCGNAEQYECDSCEHGCDDKSPTHTCSTCDSDCGKWTCKGHKCSGVTWIDNAFTLKLKNDNAADSTYDYITSTQKSAWNIVSTGKDSIDEWVLGKTRSTRPEYIESKSGLDYHTIIHRGETDIILAQWKNAAASLPANTDINTVSPTNYKVANTTDSVSRYSGRKTADYTTNFKVNIVEASPDKFTQYGATVEAPVAGGKCTKQGDFELQNPFEATASVKVRNNNKFRSTKRCYFFAHFYLCKTISCLPLHELHAKIV